MRPPQRPAIARGAIRLGGLALVLAPWVVGARELPLAEMARYGSTRGRPPSLVQMGELRPGDWAYGVLREGCGREGVRSGAGPLSRWEAAALLKACLKQTTVPTEQLQALQQEFQQELTQLEGRVETVEERLGALEAQAFTATTTLSGQAIFQLQADGFGGTSLETIQENRRDSGAVRLAYDVDLYLNTSFRGRDVLSIDTTLNDLNRSGADGDSTQVVSVNRLFYQFPSGPFTLTVGGLVSQDDMLAVWPSVYPAETVLNVLTLNGAPGAYNQEVGPGIGIWRQLDGFALSANYVGLMVNDSDDGVEGASSQLSGGTGTVQVAYSAAQWAIAAIYSRIQNGYGVIDEATGLVRDSFGYAGTTSAFGLGGFWQPDDSGWIPSISAGVGLNLTRYDDGDDEGQVGISQSWSVGLQWRDAFLEGNVIGMAVGQAPFATHLRGGATPNDGNLVWEVWGMWQVSDAISITPAFFYKGRPLGQYTPEGTTFHHLGVLLKTNIDF